MSQSNEEFIASLESMFSKTEIEIEGQCQHQDCKSLGTVYDYSISQDGHSSDITIFCNKHARDAGFCYMCSRCCVGDESFEFSVLGICDECEMEIEQDQADYPDDDYVDIDDLIV